MTPGCSGGASVWISTPACTPSVAASTPNAGGDIATKPGMPKRNSPPMGCSPIGSDSVIAIGHPSRPQPDAAGGIPTVAGHRRAVSPLAARGAIPTGQRRSLRNPRRRHRTGTESRARSTSRSGGCDTARRCPRTDSRSWAPKRQRPKRSHGGDRGGGRGPDGAVQSRRERRCDSGGTRDSVGAAFHRCPRRRLLPDHRRKAVARDGR